MCTRASGALQAGRKKEPTPPFKKITYAKIPEELFGSTQRAPVKRAPEEKYNSREILVKF